MADFIQPFLGDKSKPEVDDHEGKKETKEEQNTSPRPTGMGDFDYKNYPMGEAESDYFSRLVKEYDELVQRFRNDVEKYDALVQRFGEDVDETAKEYWGCADRLEEMEKDIQKRIELNDMWSHLFKEQLPKVERSSELIKNFGDSLADKNEVLDSWHCFIEEFRKIPEERISRGGNESQTLTKRTTRDAKLKPSPLAAAWSKSSKNQQGSLAATVILLLDLYITNTSTIYTVIVSVPLGSSDHNTISTLCREDKFIASTPKEKPDTLGKLFAANSTVDFQGSTSTTTINIFKVSYEQGTFPASWKIGCVQSISKKGKKTDPTNYEPVALLYILFKVMETVINTQLLKYVDNNNIMHDRQYGFNKHRSTGDLLAYVTHMWNRAIENHGEYRVVALDILKAFDRQKAVYQCFINKRRSSLEICPFPNTISALHQRAAGNNICYPIYSFADNSTLVLCTDPGKPLPSQGITRRRHHHASQVNADIVEWGLLNKIQFNVQKTQAATLTRKSLVGLPALEMEGCSIVESSSIKLLGININNNMSWHDHVATIAKTAS
nr:unnamed protein product [Callosobruchus analis]